MPGVARVCENQFGYCFKTLVLLLTMTAVGLSVAGSMQCQFMLIDLSTGTGWDAVLDLLPDNLTSAWVGIFYWGPALDGQLIGECSTYDNLFGDNSQYYLEVAQSCAVVAPIIGFIGVIIACFELICCSFFGSCIFAFIFFFAAAGVQMGTFGLFASPGWCTDPDDTSCYENNINSSTFWMMLLSGFFFFLSSMILCCSPRPDPCMQTDSAEKHHEVARKDEAELDDEPQIHHSPQSKTDEQPHYVETY